MTTFADLTKRVYTIMDLIMSDMEFDSDKKGYAEKSLEFHSRILITKNWFSRISWTNKKRFLIALLEDVNCVWTISILLKCIWNSRPKDAVLSVSQSRIWSGYDQVPIDHNRTALPLSTLREVMVTDRQWFLSLDPESQAKYLCELLMISGGPIMWEILQRARTIYGIYAEQQINDLQECNVINDSTADKAKMTSEQPKKDQHTPRKSSAVNSASDSGKPQPGQVQKELDNALVAWNATIKGIRDRTKLEEIEMLFQDGTKKRIWRVNRPKNEAMETVDFIQLLPSEIGKMILLNLPAAQLVDCARVNKYWSYLVDELRLELTTRQKINVEIEKLKDNLLRQDVSLDLLTRPEFQISGVISTSLELSEKTKAQTSAQLMTKSRGRSFKKYTLNKKKPFKKPIRNFADLNDRLERRGAADENLWKWCENVLSDNKQIYAEENIKSTEGLMSLKSDMFPCPLMKKSLSVPLKYPLIKDPTSSTYK